MILLTTSLLHAGETCQETLEIRSFYPKSGDADVPLDVRILVSFIGWGTDDQYTVDLTREDGKPVKATTVTWCYDHEGPHEVHCWVSLKPEKPLVPETDYNTSIRTTDTWPHDDGGRSTRARFTTGTESVSPVTGSPSLSLTQVWTEKDKSCGYPVARRYELTPVLLLTEDETGGAVFHLYPLDEDGEPGDNIHTIFSGMSFYPNSDGMLQVKQFLDGSVPQTDCFRIIEEDVAGNLSEPFDTCEFGKDTGLSDTGLSDTGLSDTGLTDTAPPPDTGQADDTPELVTISSEITYGCNDSTSVVALFFLPLLVGASRYSRRDPGQPPPC